MSSSSSSVTYSSTRGGQTNVDFRTVVMQGLARDRGLFVPDSIPTVTKDQLRAWFTHAVDLVGGRRIAPLFGVQRDFGTQIFTQEYEGRECDISLVPWMSHRGLVSSGW